MGFGSAALWLGASNWLSYQNSTQLVDSNHRVLKSYEIVQHLTKIYADLTVAESGRRGYVFLNDRTELTRYESGVANVQSELTKLQRQLQLDSVQLTRFEQMKSLIEQRLNLLESSVKLYEKNDRELAQQQALTSQSVTLRDRIQQILGEMVDIEESNLRRGLQQSQGYIKNRFLIEGVWIVSVLGGLMFIVFAFHQQLRNRQTIASRTEKLLQLQELSDLKLQFFAMASHEFRTPLSIILGSSQLLMNNQPPAQSNTQSNTQSNVQPESNAEKIQKNTLRIQSSAKVMTQLLDDILMLNRAEAGKLQCDRSRLELMSFCLNLVEDLKLAHPENSNIQFISRSRHPHAEFDEKLLYAILSNLLVNAIKYSSKDSLIQLILESDDRHIIFHVTDQGIGISEADLPHLYKPFYRSETVKNVSGSGLGLAVVKTCVELHQGTIDVTTGENQGTFFTVRLPISVL